MRSILSPVSLALGGILYSQTVHSAPIAATKDVVPSTNLAQEKRAIEADSLTSTTLDVRSDADSVATEVVIRDPP
jgi:hypothetical protein